MNDDIKKLIDKLMEQHNAIVTDSLAKHHERERWVANDAYVTYNSAGKAMPTSITEYTKTFLSGIRDIVAAAHRP